MSEFDEIVAGASAPARPVTYPASVEEIVESVSLLTTLQICVMNEDQDGFDLALAPVAGRPEVLRSLLFAALGGNAAMLEGSDG